MKSSIIYYTVQFDSIMAQKGIVPLQGVDSNLLDDLSKQFKEMNVALESKASTSTRTGLNIEDDEVLNVLTKYEMCITMTGKLPGNTVLPKFQCVSYDPSSEYSKRVAAKRDTYFSKFITSYVINGNIYESRYVGIKGAIMDLTPRPDIVKDAPNTYAREYVAIYIPIAVVEEYKKIIEATGYVLEDTGLIIDRSQGLVCFNCSYATESVPYNTVVLKQAVEQEDGTEVEAWTVNKSFTILETYLSMKGSDGALVRGFAFGEFGVSKAVNQGAPEPVAGSSLKLTFKLLGFHTFSQCKGVTPIRSKAVKSKTGV